MLKRHALALIGVLSLLQGCMWVNTNGYGEVLLGDTAVQTFSIASSEQEASPIAIRLEGDAAFSIVENRCPDVLEAGATCEVDVAFAPTELSEVNGSLFVDYLRDGNEATQGGLFSGTGVTEYSIPSEETPSEE